MHTITKHKYEMISHRTYKIENKNVYFRGPARWLRVPVALVKNQGFCPTSDLVTQQPSLAPTVVDLTHSSGLHKHLTHIPCTYIYADTHIHKTFQIK